MVAAVETPGVAPWNCPGATNGAPCEAFRMAGVRLQRKFGYR
jgi:hypothetical protein